MTLQDNLTLLDPFIHTKQDNEKVESFDFIRGNSTTEREKVKIDQTFCTLVSVGGQFLEKKAFEMVLKKIDEIRRIFRINILEIYYFYYPIHFFLSMDKNIKILNDSSVITCTEYH